MVATLNNNINPTNNDLVGAVRTLQAYLGRPVSIAIDNQGLQAEIIKLQTYLSTQAAAGQPSGFKWDPTKISKSIADHGLAGHIMNLQRAADLT